jgi:hypothetical protein
MLSSWLLLFRTPCSDIIIVIRLFLPFVCQTKMLPVSFTLLLAAAAVTVGAAADGQSEQFEPADFDPTEALLNQGFDKSILPVPPKEGDRAANWPCAAAVRIPLLSPMYPTLHPRPPHLICFLLLGYELITD